MDSKVDSLVMSVAPGVVTFATSLSISSCSHNVGELVGKLGFQVGDVVVMGGSHVVQVRPKNTPPTPTRNGQAQEDTNHQQYSTSPAPHCSGQPDRPRGIIFSRPSVISTPIPHDYHPF
ncbi:hypothetical protein E2C01_008421 [Portunus trituberculatus]|uniref:Uncharacterized protein n=1 Tax=Portunus trituberculatus TaxID=210409 RepID=A0A5B7D5E7_PORTR|nr:hypothetical protein [Portunus trituberculatus]